MVIQHENCNSFGSIWQKGLDYVLKQMSSSVSALTSITQKLPDEEHLTSLNLTTIWASVDF
jgi:hypothetical protein